MISIIVPVYNAEKYLEKCILSVLEQTFMEWELLLILNGCTDNSKGISHQYRARDSRIHLFELKQANVSHARNVGMEKAGGEYIVFLDSDDTLHPCALSELNKQMRATDYDMISFDSHQDAEAKDAIVTDNKIIKHIDKDNKKYELKDYLTNKSKIKYVVWGNIYKSEVIKKLKFNEQLWLGEDVCFQLEAICLADQIGIMNAKFYNNRVRNHSLSRRNVDIETLYNIFQTNECRSKIIRRYDPNLYHYALIANFMNDISWINRSLAHGKDHRLVDPLIKGADKELRHMDDCANMIPLKKRMEYFMIKNVMWVYRMIVRFVG